MSIAHLMEIKAKKRLAKLSQTEFNNSFLITEVKCISSTTAINCSFYKHLTGLL